MKRVLRLAERRLGQQLVRTALTAVTIRLPLKPSSAAIRLSSSRPPRPGGFVPEDGTIRRAVDADYRYIGMDTTDLDVGATVQRIKGAIPEVYAG
jgi:hypothetical protein